MFVEDFSGQMPSLPDLLSEILGKIIIPPAVDLHMLSRENASLLCTGVSETMALFSTVMNTVA